MVSHGHRYASMIFSSYLEEQEENVYNEKHNSSAVAQCQNTSLGIVGITNRSTECSGNKKRKYSQCKQRGGCLSSYVNG